VADVPPTAEPASPDAALAPRSGAPQPAPAARPALWRRIVVPLCVVLGCILAAVSVAATWIKLTALDTDTYVDTVGPVVQDEAVTTALSTRLTDRLFSSIDVETTVEDLLPQRAQALAPALVGIVERYAADLIDRVVESDQFHTLWVEANRVAHTQLVKILKGELVPNEAKEVVLDFGTTVRDLDERLQSRGIELPIDRDRINEAGQFVVARQDQLDNVRQAVDWLDRLAFVLPILTLIFFVLAIWLSPRRPRTIMWIGLGSIITFAILAIVLRAVRRTVMNDIDDTVTRDAADAIWRQLFSGLRTQVLVAVLLALLVAIAGWLLGGSKAAVGSREGLRRGIARLRGDRTAEPGRLASFVARYRRPVQLAAVAIGILVLLNAAKITFGLVLLAALIVIVVLVLVELIAGPSSAAEAAEAADAAEGADQGVAH
jgi:hypothetical protein